MRQSISYQSQFQEEGERGREKERRGEEREGGRAGRQASSVERMPAQVQHEVGK